MPDEAPRARLPPPRSYSIANAPRPDGQVSLLVTRMSGGASTWVHEGLRVGEQVTLTGPHGTFVSDPRQAGPVLLLAADPGWLRRVLCVSRCSTAPCVGR